MSKFFFNFLFLIGLSLILPTYAQEAQCIYDEHKNSTVSIQYTYKTKNDGEGEEKGSGFIISPSGHILTNAHVVRKQRTNDISFVSESILVRVGGLSSEPLPAEILDIDESADIALIKVSPANHSKIWPTLPISHIDSLPVGSSLMGLGFAAGGDIAIVPNGQKTADSTVVDRKPKAWWQTSLPLSEGNSGGPIFGKLGTVVGIAVAINRNSVHMTYVIPIARAQPMLAKTEVITSLTGPCADLPLCRHPSHGIERYQIDTKVGDESDWRYGGGNPDASQDSWCSDYLGQLQQKYPSSTFIKTGSRDSQFMFDNELLRIGAKYKYFCEYSRLEGPVYKEQKSLACLE